MSLIEKFRPDLSVGSVDDVTEQILQQKGLKGVCFDIDGTLAPFNGKRVKESFLRCIDYHKPNVSIATCNPERDHLPEIELLTGIKPIQRGWPETITSVFRRAAASINLDPSELAMVNDSLIILSCFAQPLGFYTIKVETINTQLNHSLFGYLYALDQWFERNFIEPYLNRS